MDAADSTFSPSQDSLTSRIIGCAITVHRELGSGLLESAYQECLCYELVKRGLGVARQVALPVVYDGHRLEAGFRPDIIVNSEVIVEVKAVTQLAPIHTAQLLTYLKLSKMSRGLLMNFHASPLITGIKRVSLSA
ncbi:MAG: GxxExxY protein [Gemmatimonadaceae bacterium]